MATAADLSPSLTLLSLPADVLVTIICAAKTLAECPQATLSASSIRYAEERMRELGRPDALTITAVNATCRVLHGVVDRYWAVIVSHYTVRVLEVDLPDGTSPTNGIYRRYYFCGLLHRLDGPAFEDGHTQEWHQYGQLHRANDLPACVHDDGTRDEPYYLEWSWRGRRHRGGDKPALISPWIHMWSRHGEEHRDDDKPAVYTRRGWMWYDRGQHHRKDGPASIWTGSVNAATGDRHLDATARVLEWTPEVAAAVVAQGARYNYEWYIDDQLHRTDGPARVLLEGQVEWYHRGSLHRVGGPARTGPQGHLEYWQNGLFVDSSTGNWGLWPRLGRVIADTAVSIAVSIAVYIPVALVACAGIVITLALRESI